MKKKLNYISPKVKAEVVVKIEKKNGKDVKIKKEILVDIIEVKFNSGIMLVRYVLDLYGLKTIKTTMIDNTPFLKKYMNII